MSKTVLWAPWRMEYLNEPRKTATDECVFCTLPKQTEDRKNLIVHRAKQVFVILNRYPYNNGHLMVVPHQHVSDMNRLSDTEMADLMTWTRHSVDALKATYKAAGFNIGMNLGEAGGAGIRHHLHMHIVPRWVGDTNFMPVIADTKSMPQHLLTSFDQLYEYFRRL